jgi:light-regulated signal transduction histidine kinase (bacteriophytochrome)
VKERRGRVDHEIKQLIEDLEKMLADRTAQLEAANQELDLFGYSVSHDLRAPLRHIEGYGRMLAEDFGSQMDDEGKQLLQRLRNATQRMVRLIDDLLKLNEVTRCGLHRRPVDLSSMAQSVALGLAEREPLRKVEFRIAGGVVAKGDVRLLGVVLENLFANAWKFTGGQETAAIAFGVTDNSEKRAYFVRDNGVGFDMAHADKLFGAFQRLHRAGEFEGTGIGLAMSQRIIHRHGGRIWADAAPGRGATFYFTL